MTGGMLPKGADSVIAQERVTVNADNISFSDTPKRGMNVRYAGEDLTQGQTVLHTGHLMRAADLGLVASLGIGEVSIYRKLKVAFFSTGDELASVGAALKTGQVYDSNRYSLHGMLSQLNVEIIDLGAIPDDPSLLEKYVVKRGECCRCGHYQRRCFSGRGGLYEAVACATWRSIVLENRHEARSPIGVWQNQ